MKSYLFPKTSQQKSQRRTRQKSKPGQNQPTSIVPKTPLHTKKAGSKADSKKINKKANIQKEIVQGADTTTTVVVTAQTPILQVTAGQAVPLV